MARREHDGNCFPMRLSGLHCDLWYRGDGCEVVLPTYHPEDRTGWKWDDKNPRGDIVAYEEIEERLQEEIDHLRIVNELFLAELVTLRAALTARPAETTDAERE